MTSMMTAVDTLLSSDSFADICLELACSTQEELKAFSKQGFTYRRCRPCDENNYTYSLLFNAMNARAQGRSRLSLDSLLNAHHALLPSEDRDEARLYSDQGDIIECLLAKCRMTGPAIPAFVVPDRIMCGRAIVSFSDDWGHTMHYLNRWFVPCRFRPPTQNVIKEMLFVLDSEIEWSSLH